jgi:UDP-glucose:glycoprotein glucosyltransferase
MMRLCSAISSPAFRKTSKRFILPDFQSPYVVKKSTESNYDVDLTAVIDPASRHAHKMAALLSAVQETVGSWVRIQVLLNPPSKHSELPLKSYFRFVAGQKSTLSTSGSTVVFDGLPRDPLFTQNIHAPDNWMVEVVKCDKDLDNIRLRDLGSTVSVESEYELEYLLVEGHCLEVKSGSPPRGVQFTLSPHNSGEWDLSSS